MEENTNEVEKLLQSLRDVREVLTSENISNATNEQLLEYIELTNQIQAALISCIAVSGEQEE